MAIGGEKTENTPDNARAEKSRKRKTPPKRSPKRSDSATSKRQKSATSKPLPQKSRTPTRTGSDAKTKASKSMEASEVASLVTKDVTKPKKRETPPENPDKTPSSITPSKASPRRRHKSSNASARAEEETTVKKSATNAATSESTPKCAADKSSNKAKKRKRSSPSSVGSPNEVDTPPKMVSKMAKTSVESESAGQTDLPALSETSAPASDTTEDWPSTPTSAAAEDPLSVPNSAASKHPSKSVDTTTNKVGDASSGGDDAVRRPRRARKPAARITNTFNGGRYGMTPGRQHPLECQATMPTTAVRIPFIQQGQRQGQGYHLAPNPAAGVPVSSRSSPTAHKGGIGGYALKPFSEPTTPFSQGMSRQAVRRPRRAHKPAARFTDTFNGGRYGLTPGAQHPATMPTRAVRIPFIQQGQRQCQGYYLAPNRASGVPASSRRMSRQAVNQPRRTRKPAGRFTNTFSGGRYGTALGVQHPVTMPTTAVRIPFIQQGQRQGQAYQLDPNSAAGVPASSRSKSRLSPQRRRRLRAKVVLSANAAALEAEPNRGARADAEERRSQPTNRPASRVAPLSALHSLTQANGDQMAGLQQQRLSALLHAARQISAAVDAM